ncbi:magnesium chelatase domain-containing protein [Geobacillus stearothermophilus]|nr:magnesium chelatase domain-containing protein [Geobacillus stearothermophilus]WJQ03599.1 magnesium chelatase domain-containing protein [Geobacillus stearothermophilus]
MQVEVQEVPGIAAMVIVGLPDASVKEAKERVLASLYAFGCDVFDKRLVVHLSPPERKKHSPMFDLAMAIGILKAMGRLTAPVSSDAAFLGSLSLDGTIQPVDGMLPAIFAAKKLGFQKVYLPYDPTLPLHHLKDLDCIFVQTLEETVQYLQGQRVLSLSPAVNYHFISAQKRLFFAHSFGISLSPFPKECAKFFVNYFGMGHG